MGVKTNVGIGIVTIAVGKDAFVTFNADRIYSLETVLDSDNILTKLYIYMDLGTIAYQFEGDLIQSCLYILKEHPLVRSIITQIKFKGENICNS